MPPWIEVSRALSTISAICVATAGCAGELTSITHALDLQWLANDVSMRRACLDETGPPYHDCTSGFRPAFISPPLRQPCTSAWRHLRPVNVVMLDRGAITVESLDRRKMLMSDVRKAARLGFDPGQETLQALSTEMQQLLRETGRYPPTTFRLIMDTPQCLITYCTLLSIQDRPSTTSTVRGCSSGSFEIWRR